MKTLVLVLTLIAGPAFAQESDWEWTTLDTIGQVAITTLLVMDHNQTVRIGSYGFEESLILGNKPSRQRVGFYFASCALLSAGLSVALPRPYRNIVQGFVIGYQGSVVYHNYTLGWSMKF
jgi:hypothetical protein